MAKLGSIVLLTDFRLFLALSSILLLLWCKKVFVVVVSLKHKVALTTNQNWKFLS